MHGGLVAGDAHGPGWSGLAASPGLLAIEGDPPPYDFLP